MSAPMPVPKLPPASPGPHRRCTAPALPLRLAFPGATPAAPSPARQRSQSDPPAGWPPSVLPPRDEHAPLPAPSPRCGHADDGGEGWCFLCLSSSPPSVPGTDAHPALERSASASCSSSSSSLRAGSSATLGRSRSVSFSPRIECGTTWGKEDYERGLRPAPASGDPDDSTDDDEVQGDAEGESDEASLVGSDGRNPCPSPAPVARGGSCFEAWRGPEDGRLPDLRSFWGGPGRGSGEAGRAR